MLEFYVLIYQYIHRQIGTLLTTLQNQVIGVAAGLALILFTIWIMIQGFRIITGQSRDSMIGFVVNSLRIYFILVTATTFGIFNTDINTLFTSTLQRDVTQLFTGDNTDPNTLIDNNLAYSAFAMSAIDAVQSAPGDADISAGKARASSFAIFGTASPPMAAGAMLLMYNLGIALFVGLGPLFILCLLFEQTKPLFNKWLMYGLGTVFSIAMLSFITTIVLKVTLSIAEGLWTSSVINGLLGTTSEGLTTQAMEQGGIGLLMTMLILSAPPMAGNFFSATLGNFLPYSSFGGGGSRPGPQGQPAGSYGGGHAPSQANAYRSHTPQTAGNYSGPGTSTYPAISMPRGMGPGTADVVQPSNAPTPNPYLPPSSGQG